MQTDAPHTAKVHDYVPMHHSPNVQSFLDAIPHPVALLDPAGIIVAVNRRWQRLAAANRFVAADAGLGQNYLGISPLVIGLPVAEVSAVAQGLQAVQTQQRETFELEYLSYGIAQQRWYMLSITRFVNAGQIWLMVNHQDITRWKIDQQVVWENEARYRMLSDRAVDFIYAIHVDHNGQAKLEWVSPTFTHLTGYRADEIRTWQQWCAMVYPDDLALAQAHLATVCTGQAHTVEYRLMTRDGRLRWFQDTAHPVWNAPPHRIMRILGAMRDITEQKQAEAALQASEARYRAVSELTSDYVYSGVITPDGHLQLEWVTDSFERITGYTLAELAAADGWTLQVHPDDRPAIREGITRLQAGQIDDREFRLVTKDGRLRWMHTRVRPDRDASAPALTRILGATSDITARKQAEMALHTSEARYRSLSQLTSDYVYAASVDPDGTIIVDWMTDAFTRITGYTLDEVPTSRDWASIVLDEDQAIWQDHITQLRAGKANEAEYRIYHKDGSIRWLRSSASPILAAAEQRVIGILVAVRDISDYKRASLDLRESQERYVLATRAGRVGVWDWNPVTDQLLVEPHFKAMLGFAADDLADTSRAWFRQVYPADLAHIEAAIQACLDGSQSYLDVECRLMDRYGAVRWFFVRGTLLRDAQAQPYRMVGASVDITERKQLEQQLRAMLQEKEVLLKEVHHRVKNNLQVILSLLDLHVDTMPDMAHQSVLRNLHYRIHTMALVHETLYQSNNMAEVDSSVYLQHLLDYLLRSYAVSSAVTLDLDLAPIFITLDTAIPCGLILNEIVSNALKYAFPDDRPGILRVTWRVETGAMFVLQISDNGVGLPAGVNLDNPPTLGLQLVRLLTQQLRGTVTFDTHNGLTVTITFPIKQRVERFTG